MCDHVCSSLLSATIKVLLDRLDFPDVLNLLFGRSTVELKLKELRRKLLVLDSVLDDAESKCIRKKAVKKWLDELKDAVYGAEDLVDEITGTEAFQCKVGQIPLDQVIRSIPIILKSVIGTDGMISRLEHFVKEKDAFGLSSKLDEMISRLEDFVKEKDALGLKGDDGGKSHVSRLPTTSLVDETYVFGRDSEKEHIINLLLSDKECRKEIGYDIGVVPIVGMGGIGKTTLSQIVYNDARLDQHFQIKAWVFVSDVFDILGISKLILEGITRIPHETGNLDEIQVSLQKKLCGKKYLIVMDDVWNDNYEMWEILRRPLTAGAYGSKIIATTRNQSVASIMQTLPIQNLKPLSNEDCFDLFSKIAFTHGRTTLPQNLKMMVERYKGLPLAAKTLGSLLRSKLYIERNDVLKSDLWEFPQDKDNILDNILPTLRLSYYNLPSQLKQCFAYCSVFPKGYKFQKEMLVLIWMAQGFVQSRANKTMEKIGEEYFDELVSRSLFQQSDYEVTSKQTYFTMHDLIHDLAQAISGQFSIHLEDDKKLHDIPKIVRHISLGPFVREKMDIKLLDALGEVKSLRTFLSLRLDHDKLEEVLTKLPRLPHLRVVSSPRIVSSLVKSFVDSKANLRFLDLSGSEMESLPENICDLYNLQTLLLRECHMLTRLPSKIEKLVSLRHLDISTQTYRKVSSTKLKEMPMQISQLTGLQQLSNYVLGYGLGFEGLEKLYHLQGSLCISNLQNVANDALVTQLKERALLKELQFEWHGYTSDRDSAKKLLEKLQPHTNLTSLSISGYGGQIFPDWLKDPSFTNMVTLSLYSCEHCYRLPALGQLPSLQELAIESMSGLREVGEEFYGNVPLDKRFQCLKKLAFRAMYEWEGWFMSETVEFSRLQELRISDCPKLTGTLPTRIPSLQKFVISNCPKLEHFPPFQFYLNLQELKMMDWAKLESLSIPNQHELQNLNSISLEGCKNMVSVAEEGLPAPNIRLLSVGSCTQLTSLPKRMCTLEYLSSLIIYDCPQLESFPEGGLPSNLSRLEMGNCEKLVARRGEWGIQTLSSLQHFGISNEQELKSFPDEKLLPSTLTRLEIRSLPNLESLNNSGLQLLGSLEVLRIVDCPRLKSLTEDLPNSSSKLRIIYDP